MKSKFIGSRAVDPSVEDSLAYRKSYRPMTNFANPLTQRTGGEQRLQPAACIVFHSTMALSLSMRRRACGIG